MKRNTKEEILLAALQLFAQKGYDGVGMREIAAALGIRQSSLYKHFPGKQAIFDAVVARMYEQYSAAAQQFGMPGGALPEKATGYGHASPQAMEQLGERLFRYWTEDAYAAPFRRMVTMEQYRSPAAAKLYHTFFYQGVIAHNTALFSEMMQQGWLRAGDAAQAALAFYGPIFMLMAEYDSADETERAAMPAQVAAYVADFGRRYTVAQGEEK